MGKFGIGARVRDNDGDPGEIVDKRKGERLVRYDDTDYGSLWQLKGRLSALPLEVVANDNDVSPCAPVFEKEYSVGDRVRVKSENNIFRIGTPAGCEGTITAVYGDDVELNLDHPSDGTIEQVCHDFARYLELLPAPVATPTFAKGDRALSMNGDYVTVDTDPDADGHVWVSFGKTEWRTPVSWLTKWEPKVGDRVRRIEAPFSFVPIGFESTLVVNGDGELMYTDDDGDQMYFNQEDWEPLPVAAEAQPAAEPALWAPVAGKFGQTRDGRRVGPAVSSSGHQPWRLYDETDSANRGYESDGSWIRGDVSRHDLVAEWVEPAAATEVEEVAVAEATATVPAWNLNSAKPGDRVRCDEWQGSFFVTGKEYAVAEGGIRNEGGSLYSLASIYSGSSRWSLVEPAAPPAKFKVGDRVVIARNSRGLDFTGKHVGRSLTINRVYADGSCAGNESGYWWPAADLDPDSAHPAIGSTVTFTATGRLSAINDNGHMQVTFPDLAPAQNSFALPAKFVTAA